MQPRGTESEAAFRQELRAWLAGAAPALPPASGPRGLAGAAGLPHDLAVGYAWLVSTEFETIDAAADVVAERIGADR